MSRVLALTLLLAAGCSNSPVPDESYRRGVVALAGGDARTARVELLNVLKAQPANKAARILQARTYLQLGDGIAAESELDRARALGVPAATIMPLKAHAALIEGRPADALTLLGTFGSGYAEWIRARSQDALGSGDAAASYARATALAPNDSLVWTDAARFQRSRGALTEAMAAIDRAIAINPRNVPALTLRGELTRGQYGLRAALPWFDRAIEVDDKDVNARLERAGTLGEMGATTAMLAETRKVLSLAPGNAMAFYLQAVLAARANNFALARSLMQRTQGKLDGEPSAMLVQSGIDYAVGDPNEAVARLSNLIAMQPDNRKARRLLAAARWKIGDAAGTAAALRPLTDRPDADTYSLTLMSQAMARLGDSQAASQYRARAADLGGRSATALFEEPDDLASLRGEAAANPDDARAQVRLIRALLNSGNGSEALNRAKALRDANPGAPDSHVLVGDALSQQQQYRAAADAYRKAANIAFTEATAMRIIDALDRAGDDKAAGEVLNLFVQQNPRSVSARLLLANRFMAARRWKDAVAVYEDLRRQTGSTDAMMLNNLALAYFEQGDQTKALIAAKRAWQLDRDNPATADTFGWLLFKSGVGKAQGLTLMESAANAAPGSDAIGEHLATARKN